MILWTLLLNPYFFSKRFHSFQPDHHKKIFFAEPGGETKRRRINILLFHDAVSICSPYHDALNGFAAFDRYLFTRGKNFIWFRFIVGSGSRLRIRQQGKTGDDKDHHQSADKMSGHRIPNLVSGKKILLASMGGTVMERVAKTPGIMLYCGYSLKTLL